MFAERNVDDIGTHTEEARAVDDLSATISPSPYGADADTAVSTPAAVAGWVYAIGDIHGMDALLARMLGRIDAETEGQVAPHTVVFLGDAVNRGPHTRQVLERLIAGPRRPGCRWIVLRGNHEQAMLDAFTSRGEDCFGRWIKRGGMATLASYGGTRKDASKARARALVGEEHIAFLATLPLMHVEAGHVYVHAGVAPGVPLARQSPEVLMNIRTPFLTKRHRLPYTVVHGHTPTEGEPLLGPRRIGIDSGACVTGILTAMVVEGDPHRRRFLRVAAPDT